MGDKNHRLLQISLNVLDYIAAQDQPVSFRDIQNTFELPKSTLHNLIHTLSNSDYLQKSEETMKFSIGIRCFQTGNAFRRANPFFVMADEIIGKIAASCNETTHFAVLEGSDVIYIYKYDSTHSIRVHSEIGKKMPAHTTAIGKALLSTLSDTTVRSLYPVEPLPSLMPNSITSIDKLLEQLDEIRKTNVAYEYEESSPQVKCIAVPIVNKYGAPIAGLSLAMPIYREELNMKKLSDQLLNAKRELEALHSLYN